MKNFIKSIALIAVGVGIHIVWETEPVQNLLEQGKQAIKKRAEEYKKKKNCECDEQQEKAAA